jgi:uncharacterized protein
LPLPLVILANAGIGKSWAHAAAEAISGFFGGAFALLGVLDLLGVPVLPNLFVAPPMGWSRIGMDVTLAATGFIGAAIAANPVRRRLARVIPIEPDNPVHALALTLAVVLFGGSLSLLLFTDLLGAAVSQPGETVSDIFVGELPFLLLAVAGVGIFMRRDLREVAGRVGLVRPAWWHPILALAAAGAFFAVGQAMIEVSYWLTPSLAHRVDAASQHIFGNLAADPLGLVLLAVSPGFCEEILFRGALQPRLGLIATAVLFASIHTEYGLSVVILAVFVLALGLGLLRKYTNTTTSMTCHIANNLLAGISVGGALMYAAIAGEIVLVALAGYGIWTERRRRASVASS